ncbi:MAG: hypothetical protein EOP07_04080 [Proteobacteria bacterium]|nr:MAG: hypothetical protein EOP07_04080 [Pseudomonadota bacterium]
MFYYFGYGSNMNGASLKAKGVEPLSAEPAILKGWQLKFNIPDFFSIEGGTGNIIPADGHDVHGVLYSCEENASATLDQLEAVGINYERTKVHVCTYSGQTVEAHAYIGITEKLREGYQPSRRYLNLLVKGASISGLDMRYQRKLRSQEVKTEPVFRLFHIPNELVFSATELTGDRTAIAGAVFDMSNARPEHHYLRNFLSGKDMTLFFLRRMDSSDGSECFEDIKKGHLTHAQKRYLNNYLHEFDREYQILGAMDYRLDLSLEKRSKPNTIISASAASQSTASQVLETAEATNKFLGHENLGFLSHSHGFMPKLPPKQSMPEAFKAWDAVAADLPRLYRSLELRRVIDRMPVLDASEDFLGDSYLLRAAALLAMMTHAYNYVETTAATDIPLCLTRPWSDVRRRLGREQEVLSYIDLIVYNWRMLDPLAADPLRVENLDLLIPTVGNKEERFFYLTQTEILAQAAPVLGAIARSHDAMRRDDVAIVCQELQIILDAFESVVYESLPKINPNAASHSFVDAVTWAKTVAPFAVPLKAGVQGPSGTSSPIFNLLDVYFGRVKFETILGKEIKSLRGSYPHFWQEFIRAVGSVSISEWVAEKDDPSLSAIFRETFAMYAGSNGFLGRHRAKVYGYLETAFKVGRNVTIGGFSGLFKERTWEQVDMELEYSRMERTERFPPRCYYGLIKSVGQTHLSASESVKHVVIDISDSGIFYRPGDRCGILPENSDHLIDHTLDALEASGEELIQLTEEWLKAVQLRFGYEQTTHIDLRTFLRFAKLRPVVPRVAEALHALSQNPILACAIKNQTTAQWQLSDLIALLKRDGMDPSCLWRSQYHEASYIARILPPEQFRMYSISSGLEHNEVPSEIHLTVGRLRYREEEHPDERHRERFGTASNFLATSHGRQSPVSIIIDHPPRFSLPHDPSVPIIMIGGGTGLAPFRSFIASRMQQKDSGKNWLLLSLASREHFYYQEDLLPAIAHGLLDLDVIFTREDSRPVFERTTKTHGKFRYDETPRMHIQELLQQDGIAEKLWRMLQKKEEGGEEAYLYICGRTRFAKVILDALRDTFARFFEDKTSESAKIRASQEHLAKIAAEGRFMQEIFTHARSWNTERKQFNVSDIVDNNRDENGYWMIIDSVVYDFTDFLSLHPGGKVPLLHYCGLDATQAFNKVHIGHSEIEAMRDMYEVGVIRPLDFRGHSRVVEMPGSISSIISISALYRKWVGILYLVTEMENALRLDQGLQVTVTTRGELATERTPYKIQRAIETHQRFISSYANELGGKPFIELWDLTRGMSSGKSHWMKDVMNAIHDVPNAKFPTALGIKMNQMLEQLVMGELEDHTRDIFLHACDKIESIDLELIQKVKECLKRGVKVFEEFEVDALEKGAWRMIAELQRVPVAFESYYHEMHAVFTMIGGCIEETPCELVPLEVDEAEIRLSDSYWSFEEHADERVIILRRTPIPVSSLDELVASNDCIIAMLDDHHRQYGIVVDMREAPQRNDAEFENAMSNLRQVLASTFARITVLLETTPGLLQVSRIGRNDGSEIFATTNEYAAVKFAKSAMPEHPAPSASA